MIQKLCIITGVGEGTGQALVKKFSANGYNVAMIARNKERLQSYVSKNVYAYPCDLGNATERVF